jgi:hypothetical protein
VRTYEEQIRAYVQALKSGRPTPDDYPDLPTEAREEWPVLEAALTEVLAAGAEAPSHVLNLGHGVPPDTDPGVLTRIVEFVHGAR